MKGRHELKFYINPLDYIELRTRLLVVAKPDENSETRDGYKIRNLYFDNYADKVVMEKLSGQAKREKFRIRYYKDDPSFIRLEKKSKYNRLVYKEYANITTEQCNLLLNCKYSHLKQSENPLLLELYSKIHYEILRPRIIVDYQREAYVYPMGKVRITIDSNIRTTNKVMGFFNPGLVTIPAAEAIILEVKYDNFIPAVIQDIIQIDSRNQTEFSKYMVARFV